MEQIFLAFENEANRHKLHRLLEQSGFPVRGLFTSGAQTLRAVRRMGGGVVVCGYKLPDMTADMLADDLEGSARVVVIAHADRLDACQHPDITRIAAPFSREELISAILRLCREDEPRRQEKRRLEAEHAQVVAQAKARLMHLEHLDEPTAHRRLQVRSMALGKPIHEIALAILRGENP